VIIFRVSKWIKSLLTTLAIPLGILALGVLGFIGLKATQSERPAPVIQERVWRVAVMAVQRRDLAPELELYGRVETPDLLDLTAPAAAWVATVPVHDGDVVEQGTLLARLDERDFLLRITQAQADIARLKADIASEQNRLQTDQLALAQERELLELAEQTVVRQQRLKTQRVGAEQALDDARDAQLRQMLIVQNREMSIADHPARLQRLEADQASAQARLHEAQLKYTRSIMYAPELGVVTEVSVTPGDQVAQGASLLRFYPLAKLEIRAKIPAPYQNEILAALSHQQSLTAITPLADTKTQLTLHRLAGEAQASGIDAFFRPLVINRAWRLGQLTTVQLQRAIQKEVIAVPFTALYGQDRLYTVVADRLQGVNIEVLGPWITSDGDQQLLIQSTQLQTDDRIVITHLPNALDGLRVQVVE
jgi:multidrug efflux pump subunit AcrA (membrane-fusion protein)